MDLLTALDPLARTQLSQRRQSPSASNYDTTQTDYDLIGRVSRTTLPFSASAGTTSSTAAGVTYQYDALGRPTLASDSASTPGTVSYSYSSNDVYVTAGQAGSPPSGENNKRRQLEYDGLGRLKSVCEVTSLSGSGTCSQTTSQTGYWTQYTYNELDKLTGVTQNAQGSSQTRSFSYDGLGRMTSETNPESGATNYYYDSDNVCGLSYPGDLIRKQDAAGSIVCYFYDALHRVTEITYTPGTGVASTPTKYFVYDVGSLWGISLSNTKGRLAAAYVGVGGDPATLLSYSARGEVTDTWQYAPHGSGWYHITQSYWANGAPYQLSGISGMPTITYSVDSEGRPSTVNASSGQNPVTSVSYNTAGLPTALTFGSSDSDSFSFDANTNRMTQYQFTVNGSSDTGTLTWNSNGSLASLAISDALNSSNSQTCGYSHDDLSRIAGVSCGSTWAQTFSFDPFGNIGKSGSISFAGSYSTSTNRLTNMSSSYDSNGNLTGISSDATYGYSWDAEGKPVSITRSGSTANLTYDALGKMVEQNRSGSYTQILYGPGGSKLALMNGSTLQKAFVPLPAGAQAVYNGSGLAYYRHPDWLGTSRLASTPSRTLYYDGAYAPYGEPYSETGTTDRDFTGQNQDTHSGLYDFMYREYHPVSGRWNSPDPAGLAAVDLLNPQSLNRYAYVSNNPANLIDPLGMFVMFPWDWFGGGGGACFNLGYNDPYQDKKWVSTGMWCVGGGGNGGGSGGNGGGDGGDTPNPSAPKSPNSVSAASIPWYQNPCIKGALAKGAATAGLDAIGLLPEGKAFTGAYSLFHGAAGASNGLNILQRIKAGAGIITTTNSLNDGEALSTALGVAGFIPGLGQLAAGASIVVDLTRTGMAVAQCQ